MLQFSGVFVQQIGGSHPAGQWNGRTQSPFPCDACHKSLITDIRPFHPHAFLSQRGESFHKQEINPRLIFHSDTVFAFV